MVDHEKSDRYSEERKGDAPVKRMKQALLMLAVAVMCTACQAGEEAEQGTHSLIFPDTTAFEENGTQMTVAAENEHLQLLFQESTAQFMVKNKKDGSVFNSVTQTPTTPSETSLFEIYYMNSKDNFATMYSSRDSVEKGQYQTEKLENGLKISFTVGEVDGGIFCPPAISKDRFESIVEKIEGKFDKNRFSQSYFMPDLDNLPEKKAQELLEKYPDLKSEPIYVLTEDNLPDSMKKEISRILISAGYTQEDYEQDMRYSEGLGQNKKEAFNLNLYLTLEGDKLRVRIPMEEIEEMNGGKIVSLSLLKNFASPEFGEKGYFLLPDGTGTLMNFYNGKGDLSQVRIPVYGQDRSVPVEEQIFAGEIAYLPLFAASYQKKAVLSVIQDGEAFAEIRAWPGNETAHGYAAPTFMLRQKTETFLGSSTSKAEAFQLLQKKLYDGDLVVDYYFLEEEENSLAKIADTYAKLLFGEEKALAAEPAVYLEFIGAVYEEKSEMSLGTAELKNFTTVAQVRGILEELTMKGVEPLVVRLNGFGKDGLDTSGIGEFQLNKELGSEAELKELAVWAVEQGIELYLDTDPQYVYRDKIFDGFSKNKNTVFLLNKKLGLEYPFEPATMGRALYEQPRYLLNMPSIEHVVRLHSEKVSSLNLTGSSFRDLGYDLNSDFHKSKAMERQNTKKAYQHMLEETTETQSILVNGANAFVLPYVDHVLRVETNKPRFDAADQTIPFLPMVLGGRVGFSDIPVNLSGNSDAFAASSLGSGAGYTYVLTGMENQSLRMTTHSEYYSTQYEVWKEDILKKSEMLKQRKQSLSGKIIDCEVIEQDVFRIEYENGGWILWNLSGKEYIEGSKTVLPGNYLMGGE